jgi:hypothetical protein
VRALAGIPERVPAGGNHTGDTPAPAGGPA